MKPAMPAQNALKTYTMKMMRRDRIPASRLASELPPTDSMSMPSAVRRVRSAARMVTATAMKMANGNGQPVAGPDQLVRASC